MSSLAVVDVTETAFAAYVRVEKYQNSKISLHLATRDTGSRCTRVRANMCALDSHVLGYSDNSMLAQRVAVSFVSSAHNESL